MPVLRDSGSYALLIVALGLLGGGSACQNQPTAVSNVSTNINSNMANANVTVSATPATTDPGVAIEAREPERYRAALILTAETTGGEKAVAIPQLTAEVARDGASRRIAFKLPNNEELVYLDLPDKRYVIAPNRKQYAELTPEATGFEVPRMMTPGQIVAQAQKLQGYKLAGEEQVGGRTALKYTYAGTSKTNSTAGDVKAEAYVYVDKETGLPLRSEIASEAEGNVQGVKGIKIITEMRDIKAEVDPKLFEVPEGYNKVTPEQVRAQINAFMSIAQAIMQNVVAQQRSSGGTAGATTPAPTTTPVR